MNSAAENPTNPNANGDLRSAARAWLQKTDIPVGIQQWVSFHHNPTLQMHPSRWGDTEVGLQHFILQCPYARAYVDEYFRSAWGWEDNVWTSFKSPLMQLAISEQRFLQRFAAFAGALVAAEEIRKTVDRKTVHLLREELGEDVLNFARIQAQHLNLSVPEKCRLRDWPGSNPAMAVLNAGWLLIACACAHLPSAEWKRFLSRLPYFVEEVWSQHGFLSEDFQTSWRCLRVLFKAMKK